MINSAAKHKLKQFLFVILSIFCMFLLCYWILYDLGCAFDFGFVIQKSLGISTWFYDEAVVLPIFLSCIIFPVTAIIFLVFYRREYNLWIKLLIPATGIIHAATAIHMNTAIYKAKQIDASIVTWQILFVVYAIAALTVFIWLIVLMIKYPKYR